MKILFLFFLLVFLQTPIKSQTLPEWFRVYTFEESIVELNTNYVMFSNRKTERVRFRWSFQTPQSLSEKSDVKYQSILQEIVFDCGNRNFRIYSIEWYDSEGKLISTENKKESGEWREVESGKTMEKLFIQACKLIELRKREPALEQ